MFLWDAVVLEPLLLDAVTCADEMRPLLQVQAKTLRVFRSTGCYLVPEQAEGMSQPEAGS